MDDLYADSPAGIEIIPLETLQQVSAASDLLSEVWGGDHDGMPAHLLRALAHSGNYAMGLYDGPLMVAASVAFFSDPSRSAMHSHITGVRPGYQGRGFGRMLKQHQRDWAHARGLHRITWTFDPLVARNAHFNLRVLGVRVTDYLVNHYGPMDDGVNRGDETDRLLVSWTLFAPTSPPPIREVLATVAVPSDIAAIRRESPQDAAAWRRRVRDAFTAHLADGLEVGGFEDDKGYLFVVAEPGVEGGRNLGESGAP